MPFRWFGSFKLNYVPHNFPPGQDNKLWTPELHTYEAQNRICLHDVGRELRDSNHHFLTIVFHAASQACD